jgi:hypothetical protein
LHEGYIEENMRKSGNVATWAEWERGYMTATYSCYIANSYARLWNRCIITVSL